MWRRLLLLRDLRRRRPRLPRARQAHGLAIRSGMPIANEMDRGSASSATDDGRMCSRQRPTRNARSSRRAAQPTRPRLLHRWPSRGRTRGPRWGRLPHLRAPDRVRLGSLRGRASTLARGSRRRVSRAHPLPRHHCRHERSTPSRDRCARRLPRQVSSIVNRSRQRRPLVGQRQADRRSSLARRRALRWVHQGMRQLLQGLSRERRAAPGTVTATLPPCAGAFRG